VALNNQGFAKHEFRAALALLRLAESSLTAIAYAGAGLFSAEAVSLAPAILPSLVVGVPIGALVIRRTQPETFRRVCMSFDAWIVSFGTSTLLRELHLVESPGAFLVMAAVVLVDAWLLYRFFSSASRRAEVTYAA